MAKSKAVEVGPEVASILEVSPEPAKRKYKVQCGASPELVVSAASEADAWHAYKLAVGIRDTIHKPSIGPVEE